MNQFFKFFFASILGTLVAVILFFMLGFFFILAIAASANKKPSVSKNSVLEIDLSNFVPEHTNNISFQGFGDLNQPSVLGVHDMIKAIEYAKSDDKIKGIYLSSAQVNTGGMAKVRLLREALLDFKESGKFIMAYSKSYTQNAYYLASVADQIYLNPVGFIDFRGFGGVISFYKNLINKIGVEMDVIYVGDYKGASEQFRLTKLSPENRLQLKEYINHMYGTLLMDLSQSRNLSQDSLHLIANNFYGGNADKALAVGLVDALSYEEEAMNFIRQKTGLDKDKKIKFISLDKYASTLPAATNKKVKDVVAIIYAEGGIVDGKEENGIISDQPYINLANKLRKDSKVKAVVLRINSPGGSAVASENIWNSLKELSNAGKPIIISMGDVAASGGYYLSAAGDYILAEPTTITGSIGVVRLRPNTHELENNKLGITYDTIQTGAFSTTFNLSLPMSAQERQFLENDSKVFYNLFLKRVADARKMPVEEVHKIAQGRIWTADKARTIGLVDSIGHLTDAINIAAERAGLTAYNVKEYPSVKDPITQIIESIFNTDKSVEQALKNELGEWYQHFKVLKQATQYQGVQMIMPFQVEVK